jgi:hypothetical protein
MTKVGDNKMDNRLRTDGTRTGSTSRRMMAPRLAGAVATAILLLGGVGVARATIGITPIVAQPVTVSEGGGTSLLFNFMHGVDDALWEETWTGQTWIQQTTGLASIQGEPGAASWGMNRVDVFARTFNNNLEQGTWIGPSTQYRPSGWTVVPGGTGVAGDPVALSTASGSYDVLYKNTSGNITAMLLKNNSWSSTTISAAGGGVDSRIAVVAAQGAAYAFWVGSGGQLFMSTRASGGTTWTAPSQISSNEDFVTNNPSAIAFGFVPAPYVFVRGAGNNGNVLEMITENGVGGWTTTGLGNDTPFQGSPAAVAWNTNHIDVFLIGNDNSFWHEYYDATGWHGFTHINGGAVGGSPSVVNWGGQTPPQNLQIYMQGTNGTLWNAWWNGQWNGYGQLGSEKFE